MPRDPAAMDGAGNLVTGISQLRTVNEIPRTIGVLIATYRRPDELLRCLSALKRQTLPADDILLVLREEDRDTKSRLHDYASESLPIRVITVRTPGTVAARNAGLDACKTDILSIIDDDTSPHVDWLSRVMECYRNDPALGGVGGRDRCFDGTTFDDRQEPIVGQIQWCGRITGNHHVGFGDLREVDVLKGANMSFRAKAFANVRFDTRLKGNGAQPSEDYCFSVDVKSKGWKLAYDPLAVVDHYASQRTEARLYVGVAAVDDENAFRDFSYNQVVCIWNALSPTRRAAFFVWSSLIGTGVFPGLVQALRFTPKLGVHSWRRFLIAQRGKVDAFRDLIFQRNEDFINVGLKLSRRR
jgi:cellulose synthase/poly-beta-1,6-N-acetylglucosamine synthase-like glycosyltransferase